MVIGMHAFLGENKKAFCTNLKSMKIYVFQPHLTYNNHTNQLFGKVLSCKARLVALLPSVGSISLPLNRTTYITQRDTHRGNGLNPLRS